MKMQIDVPVCADAREFLLEFLHQSHRIQPKARTFVAGALP